MSNFKYLLIWYREKKEQKNKTEKAIATTSIELNLAARTKDVITYG